MSSYSVTEPSLRQKWVAGALVIFYAIVTIMPLVWIIATGFKTPSDAIAYPPKVLFTPTLEGYVNLFTTRTRVSEEDLKALGEPKTWYEALVRKDGLVIAGPSRYGERFYNSVVIGFGSTLLCIVLGTAAAYAFSRFKVPLKDDLLFFILSTRMMPPIAVAIPIFLMFRSLGLSDTHAGLILLYTAVNLSLSVWLLHPLPGLLQGRAAAGGDRHRLNRDILPDLRLERIRLRSASDLRHGADGAALHPHDHRRQRPGLAGGRGGGHIVSRAGRRLHDPASQAPATRHHIRSGEKMSRFLHGLRRFRRNEWELLASGLIALGVLMMMQPFAMALYSYSFLVTLVGTVMFVVVSHFPE
jgi:ABC-type spermidine/putrescine transport system permease subunit II